MAYFRGSRALTAAALLMIACTGGGRSALDDGGSASGTGTGGTETGTEAGTEAGETDDPADYPECQARDQGLSLSFSVEPDDTAANDFCTLMSNDSSGSDVTLVLECEDGPVQVELSAEPPIVVDLAPGTDVSLQLESGEEYMTAAWSLVIAEIGPETEPSQLVLALTEGDYIPWRRSSNYNPPVLAPLEAQAITDLCPRVATEGCFFEGRRRLALEVEHGSETKLFFDGQRGSVGDTPYAVHVQDAVSCNDGTVDGGLVDDESLHYEVGPVRIAIARG